MVVVVAVVARGVVEAVDMVVAAVESEEKEAEREVGGEKAEEKDGDEKEGDGKGLKLWASDSTSKEK
jgi:hypothetical protein